MQGHVYSAVMKQVVVFFGLLCAPSVQSAAHEYPEPKAMHEGGGLLLDQVNTCVEMMRKENRTVSPEDGYAQRLVRGTRMCCSNPFSFCCGDSCDSRGQTERLMAYVGDQNLMLNGQNLFGVGDPKISLQLHDAYKKDQEQQIDAYLRKDRPCCGPCEQDYCEGLCGGLLELTSPCCLFWLLGQGCGVPTLVAAVLAGGGMCAQFSCGLCMVSCSGV